MSADRCQVHDSDDELSDDDEVNRLRQHRREHRQSVLQKLEELVGDSEERQLREERKEEQLATSGVWGALHGKSWSQQVCRTGIFARTIMISRADWEADAEPVLYPDNALNRIADAEDEFLHRYHQVAV